MTRRGRNGRHLAAATLAACAACAPPPAPLPPEEAITVPDSGTVVVYVEAPRSRAGPILTSFYEQTGIEVRAEYAEALGEGFLDRLKSEAREGRVDLFWGVSPLAAIELQRAGLAMPFRPAGVRPIPPMYVERAFHWAGFAVNPRVIIYNNIEVTPEQAPQSLNDLVRPPWGGRGAMARIARGTPAYHAAALFSLWGAERGRAFFDEVRARGNLIVADDDDVLRLVTSGEAVWGFIDLDRAICAKRLAEPVNIFFPDRLGLGAVVAPYVAMLLRGAPNPAQAKGLYAYLFATETAYQLSQHDCALITLLPNIEKPQWVPNLGMVNVSLLDNAAVFEAYDGQRAFFTGWGNPADSPPDPPPGPRAGRRPMADAASVR